MLSSQTITPECGNFAFWLSYAMIKETNHRIYYGDYFNHSSGVDFVMASFAIYLVINTIFVLAVSPLFIGLIKKVKAYMQYQDRLAALRKLNKESDALLNEYRELLIAKGSS